MKLSTALTLPFFGYYSLTLTEANSLNNIFRNPIEERVFAQIDQATKLMKQAEAENGNEKDQTAGNDQTAGRPALPSGPSTRYLAKKDLTMLKNYGCWCYFEEERGKGQPVDEYDRQCKILQDGYECIRMDAEEQNLECNVWESTYNSAIGTGALGGVSMERLKEECDEANENDVCGSMICRVEGWFTQNIMLLFFQQGILPNTALYKHDNGAFDPSTECVVQKGPASEKSCCGEYPERFPFKTQDGSRQCCGGRTYNAQLLNCCEDGTTSFNECQQ